MVTSHRTVEQIITILLKYVDKKTALRMSRDLYQRVEGNKSVHETFHRISLKLLEMQDDN